MLNGNCLSGKRLGFHWARLVMRDINLGWCCEREEVTVGC